MSIKCKVLKSKALYSSPALSLWMPRNQNSHAHINARKTLLNTVCILRKMGRDEFMDQIPEVNESSLLMAALTSTEPNPYH